MGSRKWWLGLAAVSCLLVGWATLNWTGAGRPQKFSLGSKTSGSRPAERSVYPFSVVPGGVVSAAEVIQAIENDPVVRKHYEGVNVNRLVPSRVETPMKAYVSFRKGNRVYWTNKKIPIQKGEVVLTDGGSLIRGRCGNRITLLPPTSMDEGPSDFPTEVAMESPVPLEPPQPLWPAPPTETSSLTRTVEPSVSTSYPPSFPTVPLFCCGGGTSEVPPGENPGDDDPPGNDDPPGDDDPKEPVPVPEPGILALLAMGGAAVAGHEVFSRRRRNR